MIQKILYRILLNLLPVFLMVIGRDKNIGQYVYDSIPYINEKIKLINFMLYSFVLGLLIIYLYYPIRNEILNSKIKKTNENLEELAKVMKKSLSQAVGKLVKVYDLSLNVRKYVPDNSLKSFFRKKKCYKVIDYTFLNDSEPINGIKFEVSPVQRGLVGVSYARKKLVYDDDLSSTQRIKMYNLNNFHKENSVIAKTDFAIAKPIITENNKVIEIITYDTEQSITIPSDINNKELKKTIRIYSDIFSKILKALK